MNLTDLKTEIRKVMKEEVEKDQNLYISNRLSKDGKKRYKTIILKHIENGNSKSFSKEIEQYIEKHEITTSGKIKKTPYNAHITLADGEFNRYYILAVCKYAIQNNIPYVIVYRAKDVEQPRLKSEKLIGQQLNPKDLYISLKNNPFNNEFIQPNSGISIRLP